MPKVQFERAWVQLNPLLDVDRRPNYRVAEIPWSQWPSADIGPSTIAGCDNCDLFLKKSYKEKIRLIKIE